MSDIQQISMPDDHHSDLQLSRMPWPPSSFDYTMTLLCSRPPMYVRSPLPSTICDSASPPGTLIVSCRLVPPQLQDRAPGGAIPLTLDLTLRVSAPLSKRFYLNTSQNNSSEYELDAETEDEAWAWVAIASARELHTHCDTSVSYLASFVCTRCDRAGQCGSQIQVRYRAMMLPRVRDLNCNCT